MDRRYTLADLEEITGARRRSIQNWAEAGAIRPVAGTERGGLGVHRQFERDEVIVACVVHALAMDSIRTGLLKDMGNAVRRTLAEGGNGRAIFEDVIAKKTKGFFVLLSDGNGDWRADVFDLLPNLSVEDEAKNIGAFFLDTVLSEQFLSGEMSRGHFIFLNDCLRNMK